MERNRMDNFEYTINGLTDFLKCIFNINNTLRKDGEKYEVLLYRGHSNKEFKIEPAIARGRHSTTDISIFNEERNLIELAKYKLPSTFNKNMAPINLLALLQHYGIPTRLLDVTTNPLVSLFFACLDDNEDGEVIVFKNEQSDVASYPIVNAIAESYKFAKGGNYPIALFYKNVIHQPYFIEQKPMLDYLEESFESGSNWIVECCKKRFFLQASEEILRQKIQQGQFILFNNDIVTENEKNYFKSLISPIEKNPKNIEKRIIIPKNQKKEILLQLKILGISEATLFSDNIDKVCEGIYTDRKVRI